MGGKLILENIIITKLLFKVFIYLFLLENYWALFWEKWTLPMRILSLKEPLGFCYKENPMVYLRSPTVYINIYYMKRKITIVRFIFSIVMCPLLIRLNLSYASYYYLLISTFLITRSPYMLYYNNLNILLGKSISIIIIYSCTMYRDGSGRYSNLT